MINAAIMGHGVVGSGVAEILFGNKESIAQKAKEEINVKYILDLREFENLSYSDRFTKDFNQILNDDEVKVVVEVMGGINPAFEYVKACLQKGKSVVTSNKELVARHGAELLKTAKENNTNFLFEASVGGGIPIIRPISQCLAANNINSICGILNGTTNFILTKMVVDDLDFKDALSLAQKKGYAERNPDADILGLDAGRKICILASLAFGYHVYPDQIKVTGIDHITLTDIDYADQFGYTVKLIGRTEKLENGKISAYVRPELISKDSMLYNVSGVFNAIIVNGDATGDVMFYGKGAGKLPTASAVVADVIDCVKHLESRKYLFWEDSKENYIENTENLKTSLFVRATKTSCDAIKKVFGDVKVIKNDISGETVFITNQETEHTLIEKLNKLQGAEIKSVLHIGG